MINNMKKVLVLLAAAFAFAAVGNAQTPLPNDPAVKTGKLDNGMTYYIRHNDKPAQRAEFYLATHVGAIQETPDQDGLAHFLEHMCFNGLKNLPGKQMLEYEAKRQSTSLSALLKSDYLEPILRKFSFADIDDMYAAVGSGGLTSVQVVTRLVEEQRNHEKPLVPVAPRTQVEPNTMRNAHASDEAGGIRVAGLPGCQVHFAKCCAPLPGDEIIGYITRGRGVTIHSKECVNVNPAHDPARWVEAEWGDGANSSYNGSLQIIAQDRHNLLADLMGYLSALKITVTAVNARLNSNQTCTIEVTLQVANKQELDWVIRQIAKRQDTIEIYRI